jgi:hypothetical protein
MISLMFMFLNACLIGFSIIQLIIVRTNIEATWWFTILIVNAVTFGVNLANLLT